MRYEKGMQSFPAHRIHDVLSKHRVLCLYTTSALSLDQTSSCAWAPGL